MLVHLVEKSSSTRRGAQSSRHCSSSKLGFISDGYHLVPTWFGIFEWVRYSPVFLCEGLNMTNQALVVGASGIVGSAVSRLLANEGWAVKGLARRPIAEAGITPISADLLD